MKGEEDGIDTKGEAAAKRGGDSEDEEDVDEKEEDCNWLKKGEVADES